MLDSDNDDVTDELSDSDALDVADSDSDTLLDGVAVFDCDTEAVDDELNDVDIEDVTLAVIDVLPVLDSEVLELDDDVTVAVRVVVIVDVAVIVTDAVIVAVRDEVGVIDGVTDDEGDSVRPDGPHPVNTGVVYVASNTASMLPTDSKNFN